jgi:hypothetical protein
MSRWSRFTLVVVAVLATLFVIHAAPPPPVAAASCDQEEAEVEECDISEVETGGGCPAEVVCVTAVDPGRGGRAGRLRIWTDRRSYRLDDEIRVCFSVPWEGDIVITDLLPNGRRQILWEWFDDGRGDCVYGYITPPTGRECLRLAWYGARRPYYVTTCFDTRR